MTTPSTASLRTGMAASPGARGCLLPRRRITRIRARSSLGLKGFVRNEDDGSVEVLVTGPADKVSVLAGLIHKGPRFAEVRGVEEREAPMQQYGSFDIA